MTPDQRFLAGLGIRPDLIPDPPIRSVIPGSITMLTTEDAFGIRRRWVPLIELQRATRRAEVYRNFAIAFATGWLLFVITIWRMN